MSNIIAFPKRDDRENLTLDRALAGYDDGDAGALAAIMRISVGLETSEAKGRATLWLREIVNVDLQLA